MPVNYKDYQQVVKLDTPQIPKPKAKPLPKKRTKTGCLTCRKRKKKCDENVIDGKCQGCTRNFFECCWPEKKDASIAVVKPKIDIKTPPVSCASSPIIKATDIPQTPNPNNAYPSPANSPLLSSGNSAAACNNNDIVKLELSKNSKKTSKITKPSPSNKIKFETKFVITSIDKDRALVHVK